MATLWEKVQAATKAAVDAWRTPRLGVTGQQNEAVPLDDLAREQQDRAKRYTLHWSYYNGQFRRPLKVSPNKPDDNVLINHCRRIVDKGVSFLVGKEVTWQLEEGKTTKEEEALEEVWSANRKMSLLHDVALNGGVCGTCYIQILPGRERKEKPRLMNLYPGMVFPEWDPNDIDDVWAYQLRWHSEGKTRRTIWTKSDSGDRWEFWQETLSAQRRWVKEGESGKWDWPWCPIVHGKNLPNPNSFFGLSDLEDADLNDAVNFSASNINRILRLYGHPVPWGYGFGSRDLIVDPGKAVLANNDKAHLQYLQMTSDLGGAMGYLTRLTTDFYKTARVPEMDPSIMSLGAQSGFALRVLYGDLIEKTTTKQLLYGDMLIELMRRLMDYMGHGDDKIVTLTWQDPLPPDVNSEIAALGFDMQAELCSKETASSKRQYDYEVEQERIAAQQAGQVNLGAELLKQFDRGQNLGLKGTNARKIAQAVKSGEKVVDGQPGSKEPVSG